MRHLMLPTVALAMTLGAAVSSTHAQQGQGAVVRTLDEFVELDIADAPIGEAVAQLQARTGLKVTLADDALLLLPYGEQTRLRLRAANVRLRDALTAMLEPMCLRWRVQDDGVLIEPLDALRRINRRPTFSELNILAALNRTRIEPTRPALEQFRTATGIDDLDFFWHVADDEQRAKALARADGRRPCTGAEYLDALGHGVGWTWYVWGDELVVLPQEMQAQRQLKRRATLRYESQPLLDVLMDVAAKADLKLEMDPGVLNYVPAMARESFTLLMADACLDQALEAISGATGLRFDFKGLAIRVRASEALLTATTQPARPRYSFFVVIPTPGERGEEMFIIIRPDELPPAVVDKYQKVKDDFLEEAWKPYGGRPTTQPADQPQAQQ